MMDAKRGYVPEDDYNFSPESIEKMKTASRHVRRIHSLKQMKQEWPKPLMKRQPDL